MDYTMFFIGIHIISVEKSRSKNEYPLPRTGGDITSRKGGDNMRLIFDPKEIAEFDKLGTWEPIDTTNVKEPDVTTEELRSLKTCKNYLGRI